MRYLFIFLLLALTACSNSQAGVPDNKGRISDYASVLTERQIQTLAGKMKPVEANGSQTAVLLVKTLDGQSIEEYCADVFSKWKIGSKKKEDGLLLVIATADHKLRIHTGYGTESKVVDAQAFEIIQRMKVFLMKKDFYGAVNVFIDASQTLMKKD